jgi:hypothetical protein
MVSTAVQSIALLIGAWLASSGLADAVQWSLPLLAGWWAGALLICGAFWRFGWSKTAARRLYLWGWGTFGIAGTVFLVAVFLVDVIPPTDAWLIAFQTTFGIVLSAGLTTAHIASQLRKEDRSR